MHAYRNVCIAPSCCWAEIQQLALIGGLRHNKPFGRSADRRRQIFAKLLRLVGHRVASTALAQDHFYSDF